MTDRQTRNRASAGVRIAVLVAAGTLGLGALVGCRGGGGNAPAAPATKAAVQAPGTLVSVEPARLGDISSIADVTGALNSLHDVTVGVKAAGKIVAVYAREGDIVRAGQVVAQEDPVDAQAQLDQSRANLSSARANLETARTKLDQARVAYKNAQTTLTWTDAQTKSAVGAAKAALEAAKEQAAVVKAGPRAQERQQAQETLAAAKADRDQARSDLKRYQDLYRQEAVSAQQLDQAQATADSADARYNQAAAALSLTREGSRPEDIRRAYAEVEQANQTLMTAQSNRDQVNLRRADVETARVGIESAQAGVSQAQASVNQSAAMVRQAEQALTDTTIRSPINGVVAERKVEPGTQLGAGKDVMRIVELNDIYFDAQLSETQYAQVQAGQPVTIQVDALPGRTFKGTISKIYPVASSTARSFTVRIGIHNEGNVLRPQMFARGRIVLATHRNVVLVPRDAVLDYNGTSGRVFVAADNKAEERPVRIGFSNAQQVEITSGVKAGEKVVTVGQAQLQNGDTIIIQPTTGASGGEVSSNSP